MFLVIMTHMLYNYFCLFKNFYFLPFRQPTRVLLPGKSHGRRSLLRCSPRGRWGSDMTERLHFHFSLSCIGEGNGNPLGCSCLENPRDRGAWWAAVYGVTQSRTWLKRLSSSSFILLLPVRLPCLPMRVIQATSFLSCWSVWCIFCWRMY